VLAMMMLTIQIHLLTIRCNTRSNASSGVLGGGRSDTSRGVAIGSTFSIGLSTVSTGEDSTG
jgi:hypothetical protein